MLRRSSLVVPAAVAGLLAPVTALTGVAHAAAAAGPQIAEVQVHLVQPSRLGLKGGFPLQVDAKVASGNVCSFRVRYYNDNTGWHSLGTHKGSGPSLRYTDYISADELTVLGEYEVVAVSCNGTASEPVDSQPFYGLASDEQTQSFCAIGAHVVKNSADAFGGSWARTTGGVGTSVTCSTYDHAENVGVYGETGRWGGRADVYVDGARRGTVDFSSATTSYRKLMVKAGWDWRNMKVHTVTLTVTGPGAYGGTGMGFDAVGQVMLHETSG